MAESDRLIRRVLLRLKLAAFGTRFYLFQLVLAGIYAAALMAAKLLTVFPEQWFRWWTLLIIPAVALVLAAIFHRRPRMRDAAHTLDERMGTKDLFLTSTMLDKSLGEFQPLVHEAAQKQAPGIRSRAVVPFNWVPRTGHVTLALALLLAGVFFLPSLDPFGKKEERDKQQQRQEKLEKIKNNTMLRKKALKARAPKAKISEPVKRAVGDLKKTFHQMDPKKPLGNLEKLDRNKRNISQLRKDRQQRRQIENALNRVSAQRFGQLRSKTAKQWKTDIDQGKTDSLNKELEDLKDLAQQMTEETDSAKKDEIRRQIKQRLGQLSEFVSENATSADLQQALSQAMQQLDMSGIEGLSEDALKGLQESLELSQLQLEQLAQSVRDLSKLEQALKAIQQAKSLNQQQPLDGSKMPSQSESLEAYEKLLEQMAAQSQCPACQAGTCDGGAACQAGTCAGGSACSLGQGAGNILSLSLSPSMSQGQGQGQGPGKGGIGGGMGGPGRGAGGIAPEDGSATKFKKEKARSQLTKGKILLKWKTKEVIKEDGTVDENYVEALDDLKQGVSESILQEEVPPGYHDAIKKYFTEYFNPTDKPAGEAETKGSSN